MLMSAGNNWHLFSTIDVEKAAGGLQHLPTGPFASVAAFPFCTEQLDVPGVPMPVYGRSWVSWGVVEAPTSATSTSGDGPAMPEVQFERAVRELTEVRPTDGLIIDFRFNVGGNLFLSNAALSLLFDQPIATIGFDERAGFGGHSTMIEAAPASLYTDSGCAGPRHALRPAHRGVDRTWRGELGRSGRASDDLPSARAVFRKGHRGGLQCADASHLSSELVCGDCHGRRVSRRRAARVLDARRGRGRSAGLADGERRRPRPRHGGRSGTRLDPSLIGLRPQALGAQASGPGRIRTPDSELGLRTADYGLRTSDFGLRTDYFSSC